MRPQGRDKLDSVYFDYPTFEVAHAPELDGRTGSHDVVIVGLGRLASRLPLSSHAVAFTSVVLTIRPR